MLKGSIISEEKSIFFVQCSVTQLPFADDSFDMTTACEILEHLDSDGLMEALKELYRALVPGGYLFVTTPYNEELRNFYVKCPECGYIFPPSGHYCSFNENKWRSFTADIGFAEVNIKKIYGIAQRCKIIERSIKIFNLIV